MDIVKIIKRIGVSILIMLGTLFNSVIPEPSQLKEIGEIKSLPLQITENFTITAHAGAMNLPDNSLPAISAAVAANVDVVEIDLTFRPDGTPIMVHDSNPGPNDGVLLDDAFAVVAKSDKICINLDCKSLQNMPDVYKLLEKYQMVSRAFFTGVDESSLSTIKAQCPIPYYLNYTIDKKDRDSRECAQALADKMIAQGFIGLNCSFDEISRTYIDVMHKNGLLVSAWTVNNTMDMYRMLSLSVDNITTKRPLELKTIIETW